MERFPSIYRNIFETASSAYGLRSNNRLLLRVLSERTLATLGDRAFAAAGSKLWNSEQLFTEVEVNGPGYSPSHKCGEVNILGFSPTLIWYMLIYLLN